MKMEQNPEAKDERPCKRKALNVQKCFFCEKGKEENVLHEVSTFGADENIRKMITQLNDTKLMTTIVGPDLIAMEAKYHLTCMVHLRNRYCSLNRKTNQRAVNTDEEMNESRAFVELTRHIEKFVDSGTLLFKPSEIHSLYVHRLAELGIKKLVNKTRLKDNLLELFTEAQEQCDGTNIIATFKESMRNMLRDVMKNRDFSEDAVILAKAAEIVIKDVFNHNGIKFTGYFPAKKTHFHQASSHLSL